MALKKVHNIQHSYEMELFLKPNMDWRHCERVARGNPGTTQIRRICLKQPLPGCDATGLPRAFSARNDANFLNWLKNNTLCENMGVV